MADTVGVLATSTTMGVAGAPVVVGFLAGDLLYEHGLKDYINGAYGGQGGALYDELTRSITMKTAVSSFTVWAVSSLGGESMDLIDAAVMSGFAYLASRGIQDLVLRD